MPWKECHVMDERLRFVARLLDGEQMALIQDVQTDEWWQDVTVPMLELVRRRLRDLVKLIEKHKRKLIFTDFEDQMGAETGVSLPGFGEREQASRTFGQRPRHTCVPIRITSLSTSSE
jgi:type I site-specific restriction endonuclease